MHFCSKCDNMYYIRINENDNNKLVYYCRNCGNVDNELSMTNLCVSKTKIRQNKQIYSHMINEYTKNDVTLPRTKTIKCPNQDCKSNKKKENEKEKQVLDIIENFDGGIQKHKMRSIILLVMILLFAIIVFIE